MHAGLVLLLTFAPGVGSASLGAGCRADEVGLELDAGAAGAGDAAAETSPGEDDRDGPGDAAGFSPSDEPGATEAADAGELSSDPPRGVRGAPAEVGCADGSREGFADLIEWPGIAACAGGFRVPGLDSPAARTPQCQLEAGNTGANPAGVGCSAADLCAAGWQVCEDAGEVARLSATGCAGAAPPGFALFYVVRAGASADGLCIPGSSLRNDLHGCGSFGAPEHPSCAPLDRRLDFAACFSSRGHWSCGDDQVHLQETVAVSKAGPSLGGVLCCRQVD